MKQAEEQQGWSVHLPVFDVRVDGPMVSLLAGRSLISAGISMMGLVGPSLLLENNKSAQRADRVRAVAETLTTLSSFFARPMIGQIIDSQGRRNTLIAGPIFSAFARAMVVAKPGNVSYLTYRVLNLPSMIPLFQSFTAILADRLGGRGSEDYIRFNKLTWSWLAFVRMVTLRLVTRIKNKKLIVLMAVACNLSASLIFYLGVRETLTPEKKKPFVLKTAANPFFFVRFFQQTPKLRALALLVLLRAIPDYNGSEVFYRRQKFGWGLKERARITQIYNLVEIVGPMYSVPLMQKLGPKRTAICAEIAQAVANLNVAFASGRGSSIYLNPIINSLFDYSALECLTTQAAQSVDAGQGELSSALMNLRFPMGLLLPNWFSLVFTKSYDNSRLKNLGLEGAAPFILVAAASLFNACVSIPLGWHIIADENPA